MGNLEGKVAVITGGASGIGEATVRLFVEARAHVIIADIQDDKGQRLSQELGEQNTRYVHTDVTQEKDVQAAINQALTSFGRLDCMFNNAGLPGPRGPVEDISIDGFQKTIDILFKGVFLGMKYAAPIMKEQGSGSIISTGSVAGLRTGFADHTYSAAKAAVIHLTKSVAMELGESGVRVNCICPGGVATAIFGRAIGLSVETADQTVEVMQHVLTHNQALKRAGLPEDIARAALWLASDESSFVNGHALVVDGGLIGGRTWSESQRSAEKMMAAMNIT